MRAGENLLFVRGAVPGARRGYVEVRSDSSGARARRARPSVALDDTAFTARFNGPLLHESVRAELAARRRGTAATKTRGLVSGGNSKPGARRARAAPAPARRARRSSPAAAPYSAPPRSYTFKVNRKERRAALRSALSLHAERGSLAILDAAAFEAPSTKTAAGLFADWGRPRGTLVVVTGEERGAGLYFRNIERVAVLAALDVGVADIVGAASMLCSEAALAELTERALGEEAEAAEEASA